MPKASQKIIDYLRSQGGVARFSAILRAGFHPDLLTALHASGKVEKLARGLYRLTGAPESQPDIIAASLQAPRGVVCLISALSFHEVTTEIPKYVDLAVPRGSHANRIAYPPVRFFRFSHMTWQAGVEEHRIDGHTIRIFSLAKTIADCFKFRNQIGIDIARAALRIAVTEKSVKPKDIMMYAGICRVSNIMKPILEMMS